MTTHPPWTLYHAQGTCAQAVHIALLEAEAAFDTVWLDFSQQQQRSPDFLRVNPKGRVPALATPQGVLTEVPALLLFVAQTHPQANLAPLNDPFELARLQSLNSYLASTVHVAHAHKRRGSRWADEPEAIAAMQRKVAHNMTEAFALIEADWLADGPWALGERYSVADAYLFTIGQWLAGDGVDEQQFPRLLAHRARMQTRPAVQAALTEPSTSPT
jgi:glutathione S-transferase